MQLLKISYRQYRAHLVFSVICQYLPTVRLSEYRTFDINGSGRMSPKMDSAFVQRPQIAHKYDTTDQQWQTLESINALRNVNTLLSDPHAMSDRISRLDGTATKDSILKRILLEPVIQYFVHNKNSAQAQDPFTENSLKTTFINNDNNKDHRQPERSQRQGPPYDFRHRGEWFESFPTQWHAPDLARGNYQFSDHYLHHKNFNDFMSGYTAAGKSPGTNVHIISSQGYGTGSPMHDIMKLTSASPHHMQGSVSTSQNFHHRPWPEPNFHLDKGATNELSLSPPILNTISTSSVPTYDVPIVPSKPAVPGTHVTPPLAPTTNHVPNFSLSHPGGWSLSLPMQPMGIPMTNVHSHLPMSEPVSFPGPPMWLAQMITNMIKFENSHAVKPETETKENKFPTLNIPFIQPIIMHSINNPMNPVNNSVALSTSSNVPAILSDSSSKNIEEGLTKPCAKNRKPKGIESPMGRGNQRGRGRNLLSRVTPRLPQSFRGQLSFLFSTEFARNLRAHGGNRNQRDRDDENLKATDRVLQLMN